MSHLNRQISYALIAGFCVAVAGCGSAPAAFYGLLGPWAAEPSEGCSLALQFEAPIDVPSWRGTGIVDGSPYTTVLDCAEGTEVETGVAQRQVGDTFYFLPDANSCIGLLLRRPIVPMHIDDDRRLVATFDRDPLVFEATEMAPDWTGKTTGCFVDAGFVANEFLPLWAD